MDLFVIIGLLIVVYYSVYLILPSFLDCDILLAFKEKYGKSVSSLKGKTVWITGASAGIGEHLAYVLAKAGCKLILSARRIAELEQVKKTCLEENRNLTDNDVEVYPMDVLDLDSHEKAFEHVINKFGKLDILVNNAGRSQRAKWENIEIAVDKEMFNLNVFSILSLSRIAIKHFLKVGEGQIVNSSSLAGIVPAPMSATYCATKHALHGYFRPLFLEHPDNNISVTMVCPGPVQTEFLAKSFTEKSGQNYGVATDTSKNKVSVERCAILMGVAIANELDEVWIATASSLRLVYLIYCFPNFAKWIIKNLGLKYLLKLRDANASKTD
ncbi:PREDICTED: dehydrogenase/reductase SDR family member 7 isoform X1 [Atta colombica]|uniref:dehydrogenase/reductase SDR family member 7 isoform X1 n=1 Tax=Atta colombica TaxID=520822 RepID=UPI00084C02A8|nr:PREDICTED: dehydrogenase/reductase SDR family member 7 isoform X1 [Atta colombica]XP_018059844.1 PREDICTED: dehydrogenase/reductase SDR family member 7 isoform X1 [Atta colombica]